MRKGRSTGKKERKVKSRIIEIESRKRKRKKKETE